MCTLEIVRNTSLSNYSILSSILSIIRFNLVFGTDFFTQIKFWCDLIKSHHLNAPRNKKYPSCKVSNIWQKNMPHFLIYRYTVDTSISINTFISPKNPTYACKYVHIRWENVYTFAYALCLYTHNHVPLLTFNMVQHISSVIVITQRITTALTKKPVHVIHNMCKFKFLFYDDMLMMSLCPVPVHKNHQEHIICVTINEAVKERTKRDDRPLYYLLVIAYYVFIIFVITQLCDHNTQMRKNVSIPMHNQWFFSFCLHNIFIAPLYHFAY